MCSSFVSVSVDLMNSTCGSGPFTRPSYIIQ